MYGIHWCFVVLGSWLDRSSSFLGPPLDRTMMQEVLSLLQAMSPPHDDDMVVDGGADSSDELLHDYDPLPFPGDAYLLQEPSLDELNELKKRMRTKLSSRRYSRRRKEDAKMQAMLSAQHGEELTQLKSLNAMLKDNMSTSTSQLRDQLDVLLRKTKHLATHIYRLYEQVYGRARCDGSERVTRPDHLSHLKPVPMHCTTSTQFELALFNASSILSLLSDPARDGCPEFTVSTYAEWRMVEFKRRGSRFCALASRKIFGISRDSLIRSVWHNAGDERKRVSTAARYAYFSPVTEKNHDLQGNSSEFYTGELHEFPDPFLCRSFMSIHGAHDGDRGFWYVKQSLKDPPTRSSHVNGSETLSTVIQDGKSDDGRTYVTVDLVVLYDTHGICHLERLISQEPPLCYYVVQQWERNHLSPEVQCLNSSP